MSPQQLAKQPRRDMTLRDVVALTGYEPTEIALVARTVALGAPLEELAVFLHACHTLHLDPLLRQAYWIRRKQKDGTTRGTLQVGIDGFRAIAERAGNYAGSAEPVFRGYQELGQTKLTVPIYCQVTCWKIVAGHKASFTGEARWDEFYPGDAQGAQWRQRPHHMLAKCAEAQALRKGWPAQLASLAMEPEMDGAQVSVEELPTVAAPAPPQEAPVAPRRTVSVEEYDRIFYGADAAGEPPAQPQDAPGEEPDELDQ